MGVQAGLGVHPTRETVGVTETHAVGSSPAPGKLVMVATSTATMKSASVLVKPHEPTPDGK